MSSPPHNEALGVGAGRADGGGDGGAQPLLCEPPNRVTEMDDASVLGSERALRALRFRPAGWMAGAPGVRHHLATTAPVFELCGGEKLRGKFLDVGDEVNDLKDFGMKLKSLM